MSMSVDAISVDHKERLLYVTEYKLCQGLNLEEEEWFGLKTLIFFASFLRAITRQ